MIRFPKPGPALRPCPLCGGEALVTRIEGGFAHLDATIRCRCCHLTLDWSTDFFVGESADGQSVAVKQGLNPFEAWNRRAKT